MNLLVLLVGAVVLATFVGLGFTTFLNYLSGNNSPKDNVVLQKGATAVGDIVGRDKIDSGVGIKKVSVPVQLNGKSLTKVLIYPDATEEEVNEAVFQIQTVNDSLVNKELVNIVYVPKRLINIVARDVVK